MHGNITNLEANNTNSNEETVATAGHLLKNPPTFSLIEKCEKKNTKL